VRFRSRLYEASVQQPEKAIAGVRHVEVAWRRPNRLRVCVSEERDGRQTLCYWLICDGETVWLYGLLEQTVQRFQVRQDWPPTVLWKRRAIEQFLTKMQGALPGLSQVQLLLGWAGVPRLENLRLLPEDTHPSKQELRLQAEVEGHNGEFTLWLQRNPWRLRRVQYDYKSWRVVEVVETWVEGEALEEDLFRFTPPAGTEVFDLDQDRARADDPLCPPDVEYGAGYLEIQWKRRVGPVVCGMAAWQSHSQPYLLVATSDHFLTLTGNGQTHGTIPLPAAMRGRLSVADLDGDGDPEILAASPWSREVTCCDGAGRVKWQFTSRYKNLSANGIAVLDMDGDGRREVAVAWPGGEGVHLLQADGSVRWYSKDIGPTSSLVGADLDGDGRQELLCAAIDLQVVDRNGAVSVSYKMPLRLFYLIDAVDLDADGSVEILCLGAANETGPSKLHHSTETLLVVDDRGREKWRATLGRGAGYMVTALATGDLDGDGQREIALGTMNQRVFVYNSQGDLRWRIRAFGAVSALCMSKLTDNSSMTLAVGTNDGNVYLYTPGGKR
jgi:outer membrane lipoprotein-sorting protein